MEKDKNAFEIEDLVNKIGKKLEDIDPNGWLNTVKLVPCQGDYEKSAVEEWMQLIIKHAEKLARYAHGISVMKGAFTVDRDCMKQAATLIHEGLDSDIIEPSTKCK